MAPKPFKRPTASDAQQTPKPITQAPPATAPVNRKRSAEEEVERPSTTEKRARQSDHIEYPKLPENASNTAKLFQAALDKPASQTSQSTSSLFAPAAKSSHDSVSKATPAADVEKKQDQPSAGGFKPSTSGFTPTNAGDATNSSTPVGGFKPTGGLTPLGGFKPTNSTGFTPSSGGFTPSAGGFKPTASGASSGSFLSAFGQSAAKQEVLDRKKRQDEDYDSEEETKEEWLARDKAKQEEKRAKYLETVKAAQNAAGFVPKASAKSGEKRKADDEAETASPPKKASTETSSSSNVFSSQTPASKAPSANMFGSISNAPTSNVFGSTSTPAASGTGSSLFGHLSKTPAMKSTSASESSDKGETVEKDTQGTGNNTWNQSTPIKFGNTTAATTSTTPAAPPSAFGNLFGASAAKPLPSSTGLLNVPGSKPTTGWNFGGVSASNEASRASTPGITTDGEGTSAAASATAEADTNEPSDDAAPPEVQVEDMTGLSAEELKSETLLYTVARSKGAKWDDKRDDAGNVSKGWLDKGKGPLYILKNQESGKVKVLMKMAPLGKVVMNFAVLKQKYEVVGKAEKQISCTFYDHMCEKPGLGKWLLTVGKKEDAVEIARILTEASDAMDG